MLFAPRNNHRTNKYQISACFCWTSPVSHEGYVVSRVISLVSFRDRTLFSRPDGPVVLKDCVIGALPSPLCSHYTTVERCKRDEPAPVTPLAPQTRKKKKQKKSLSLHQRMVEALCLQFVLLCIPPRLSLV